MVIRQESRHGELKWLLNVPDDDDDDNTAIFINHKIHQIISLLAVLRVWMWF